MDILKKQSGYALLMVLMLVIVLTILGLGLLGMNISASKQFTKNEEQVKVRHLAEMGVLHYKADIKRWLQEYEDTTDQTDDFCTYIDSKETTETSNHNYAVVQKEVECRENEKLIVVNIESKGIFDSDTEALIDAKIYLTGTNENPPDPPENGNRSKICIELPIIGKTCTDIVSDVLDLTNLFLKKESLVVKDNLLLESMRVGGGVNTNLTVAKDLYIKNLLDVQTHACIIVEGNLTVLNSIKAVNDLYIFVYGNANLPSDIILTSPNNGIYVAGDVYIAGNLQNPKTYPEVPDLTSKHGCSLPENPPPAESEKWTLKEAIDATYQ